MNSNQNPIIAREINTTFKNVTDWLDYYRTDWPTEIKSRPVIYLEPTEGGHDNIRYYHVLAAPELKAVPYEDYIEQDISQIDPNQLRLGIVRIDRVDEDTIRIFVWGEDDSPPEIWKDLFDNLIVVFYPENPVHQMVDTSLLKHLDNQPESSVLPKGKTGRKHEENYDELSFDDLLPKKQATLARWKAAYRVIVNRRESFQDDVLESRNKEKKKLTIEDYRVALTYEMKWSPGDRTIRNIIKEGDAGKLN